MLCTLARCADTTCTLARCVDTIYTYARGACTFCTGRRQRLPRHSPVFSGPYPGHASHKNRRPKRGTAVGGHAAGLKAARNMEIRSPNLRKLDRSPFSMNTGFRTFAT
jgi:hypothetical protein